MADSLSPDNEAFVQDEVASGVYHDRDAMIDAGISLLKQRKALQDHIDEGRRQLDAGDYVDYDEESLRERFQELKQRATTESDGE